MALRLLYVVLALVLYSIGVCFVYLCYIQISHPGSVSSGTGKTTIAHTVSDHKNKATKRTTKLILIFTAFFGEKPWPTIAFPWFKNYSSYIDPYGVERSCPFTNCEITYDRKRFLESDLVVFHGRADLPTRDFLQLLNDFRPVGQIWTVVILESPLNSPNFAPFFGLFNWTTTYHKNSDIFLPYNFYTRLEKPLLERRNYAAGKKKMVALLSRRCLAFRNEVVWSLRKSGIIVDVYGRCSTLFYKKGHEMYNDSFIDGWLRPGFFKSYKFYLALENSFCPCYVTEKYWISLVHEMVPVVLGGANYSDPDVVIPGSYINAWDFKTLESLAEYLKYLDANDTAYDEFHTWREKYIVGRTPRSVPSCSWCELLNGGKKINSKVSKDISELWEKEQCKNMRLLFSSHYSIPL